MADIFQDIQYAFRIHSRQPKPALIMIVTLALGIGAATAVFTVVQAVLLRPLLYKDPAQLVRIYESNPSKDATYFSVSAPNWEDWRRRATGFGDMAALARMQDVNFLRDNEPRQITGSRISSNLLPLLGVQPAVGRNFTAAADRANQEVSVILSHDFWKSEF